MEMTIRRDVVCGICGLVACVCANAGTVSEGAHPHQRESRKVEALPPEQDHTHQDFDRAVRIEDVVKYAVAPPSATLPPGQQMFDDPWITRRSQGRHPRMTSHRSRSPRCTRPRRTSRRSWRESTRRGSATSRARSGVVGPAHDERAQNVPGGPVRRR